MRILVTGANGFIGHNMTAALSLEPDWKIDGWDWQEDRPDIKQYDWVIHLGAISDKSETEIEKVMHQNFDFSCWIFNECQKHGTNLQYASSSSVYGNTKNFSEYANCQPQTAYAWSKYLFDRWVFQQQQNTYVQGFRYFSVYGKWMHLKGKRANVISKWREQARKLGYIEVWEGSDNLKRDWVWVGDVCRLHIDFIKTVKGSGLWNVGTGLSHNIMDIAETIAEQEQSKINMITMPESYKKTLCTKTCADLKHLKETIGSRKWLNIYEWLDIE